MRKKRTNWDFDQFLPKFTFGKYLYIYFGQKEHCFSSSAQTPAKLLLKACATPPHTQWYKSSRSHMREKRANGKGQNVSWEIRIKQSQQICAMIFHSGFQKHVALCSLYGNPTSALVCTLYMFLVGIVAPINTFCCRLLRGKGFGEKNRYLSLFTNSKSALNLQAFSLLLFTFKVWFI